MGCNRSLTLDYYRRDCFDSELWAGDLVMCQKCEPARIVAAKVAQDMIQDTCCSAEKTRNFYRKQGVDAERERILNILETAPTSMFWGLKMFEVSKEHLIELITGKKITND